VEVARIVRGQVKAIKGLEYIQAGTVLGYSTQRIIIFHVLPNIIGPILVMSAANFATAILLESGLSFLGLGIQPPTPSWGSTLNDNYSYLVAGVPHLALIPGIAIALSVMSFNLIGSALRDAFDERIG
jgi:peptide/nickel transport system permease protein